MLWMYLAAALRAKEVQRGAVTVQHDTAKLIEHKQRLPRVGIQITVGVVLVVLQKGPLVVVERLGAVRLTAPSQHRERECRGRSDHDIAKPTCEPGRYGRLCGAMRICYGRLGDLLEELGEALQVALVVCRQGHPFVRDRLQYGAHL